MRRSKKERVRRDRFVICSLSSSLSPSVSLGLCFEVAPRWAAQVILPHKQLRGSKNLRKSDFFLRKPDSLRVMADLKGIWIVLIQIACQFHGQLACWLLCHGSYSDQVFSNRWIDTCFYRPWFFAWLNLALGVVSESNWKVTSVSWIRTGNVLGPSNRMVELKNRCVNHDFTWRCT